MVTNLETACPIARKMSGMSIEDLGMRTPDREIAGLCSLVQKVRDKFGVCRVIEVGSWTGRTAIAMIEAGAYRVDCIDTWRGTDDPLDKTFDAERKHGKDAVWHTFIRNCGELLGTKIFGFRGTSLEIASTWPRESLAELVFIDADHRKTEVAADIAAWSEFVRVGGIVCGHDYECGWPDVMEAVDESGGVDGVVAGCVWSRWKK